MGLAETYATSRGNFRCYHSILERLALFLVRTAPLETRKLVAALGKFVAQSGAETHQGGDEL